MPALSYRAPLDDMRFCLETYGQISETLQQPNYQSQNMELMLSILEEAGKFAGGVLSPLNQKGDMAGAKRSLEGDVRLPEGFTDAYRQFAGAGWNGAPFNSEIGGQGLPLALCTLVGEMWHGANMAFGLIPMLTQSAIELVAHHASAELRKTYLPKLVSGAWTGSMCMTEPQAGSDVGAVITRAVEEEAIPGQFRLKGTKVFITYGEHDASDNIIHLVLARLPGAPNGSKGLSLFLVPKILVNADGTLGQKNDVQCLSIEEKLGIHASPTCVMAFGEQEGAIGFLVGTRHGGIAAMFTMMNQARLAVGLEGSGIMARALQMAEAYAAERVQGRRAVAPKEKAVTIDSHPDVQRMLRTLRAHSEASRALTVFVAQHAEAARQEESESANLNRQMVDLLTPVVKAHLTDTGFAMASLAVQVHGGAGYIEETGVAQLLRDARIASIYEGTNGIQALDLVERKLMTCRPALTVLLETMRIDAERLAQGSYSLAARAQLNAITALEDSTQLITGWLADTAFAPDQRERAHGVAANYLTQFGLTLEMAMLVKAGNHVEFYAHALGTAFPMRKYRMLEHFALQELPIAIAQGEIIRARAHFPL